MFARVLENVKILDVGCYVAGSYCTKCLAGFGADVIKVERPGEGDKTRRDGPFPGDVPDPEASALFLYLNTGKKSITLNLEMSSGVEILQRLTKQVDVIVEDFEPGYLENLGLGYDSLEGLNPKLVMTSVRNFGDSGPYRDYTATSLVNYAMGGYMYITGDQERPPLQGPGPQPEYEAGLHAAIGTMVALWHSRATGHGQHIEVSVMETLAALHQWTITMFTHTGVVKRRASNRHAESYHPLGPFPCKDGWVTPAIVTPEQWQGFCIAVGMPELLEDPRFISGGDRFDHADELDALILPWFMEHTREEIARKCQELRAPCGTVASIEDILNDPQYAAREFWVDIEHPVAGTLTYPGAPFKMTRTPWRTGRAPLLGEHNREVYCGQLGFSEQELVRLRGLGII